jgi:hypothetical protein
MPTDPSATPERLHRSATRGCSWAINLERATTSAHHGMIPECSARLRRLFSLRPSFCGGSYASRKAAIHILPDLEQRPYVPCLQRHTMAYHHHTSLPVGRCLAVSGGRPPPIAKSAPSSRLAMPQCESDLYHQCACSHQRGNGRSLVSCSVGTLLNERRTKSCFMFGWDSAQRTTYRPRRTAGFLSVGTMDRVFLTYENGFRTYHYHHVRFQDY